MTDKKFSRQNIKLPVRDGRNIDCEAFVSGDWAYHKGVGLKYSYYTVTHVPTGMSVGHYRYLSDARLTTIALSEIPTVWNGTGDIPSEFKDRCSAVFSCLCSKLKGWKE